MRPDDMTAPQKLGTSAGAVTKDVTSAAIDAGKGFGRGIDGAVKVAGLPLAAAANAIEQFGSGVREGFTGQKVTPVQYEAKRLSQMFGESPKPAALPTPAHLSASSATRRASSRGSRPTGGAILTCRSKAPSSPNSSGCSSTPGRVRPASRSHSGATSPRPRSAATRSFA
jgi:hypothetical protein